MNLEKLEDRDGKRETIRAVLYARVSTDDQAKGQSIDHQLETCRRFCESEGWDAAFEITDPGHSGRILDRPGIKRLAAVAPSVNRVVATAIDRLHRNKLEWALFRRDVLDPHGIEIATVTGVRDQGDPNTWLADEMEQTFAEHYSRLTSWKTVQGLRRVAEQGFWARTPPYGTKAGQVKKIPDKHPEEWPWLEEMFSLASAGWTYAGIARWLAERGVKARNGNDWSVSTLSQILRNPFYIGEIHLKGEVFQALHQCRIDTAVWEAAQRPKSGSKGGRPSEHVYLLSNVITDHWIVSAPTKRQGEPMPFYGHWVNGRGGKRYRYYYRADKCKVCGGLKGELKDESAAAMRVSIPAIALEEAVVRELITRLKGGDLVRDLRGAAVQNTVQLRKERGELARQLKRLGREQGKHDKLLVRAFAERNMDVVAAITRQCEKQRSREHQLLLRIDALDSQLGTLESAIEESQHRGQQAHLLETLWQQGKRAELKRLLDVLVHSVLVRVDGVWLRLNPVCDTLQEAPPPGIEPGSTA